jgi:hypothetical protein
MSMSSESLVEWDLAGLGLTRALHFTGPFVACEDRPRFLAF